MKNKHTYCPDLWEMVTLDNKGNIFHCNQIKPEKIGNIYLNKLDVLINNPISVKYRELSLKGRLKCYKDCNWVNKNIEREKIPISSIIEKSSLKRIHIHWGLPCNISCIMCKQRKRVTTNTAILNAEQIIKNIDIMQFDEIFLSGGEPLYISECLKYMNYLERINKKYILLTNGLLIDNKLSFQLAKHAQKVIISINAATKHTHEKVNRGSDFNLLINNIQNLKTARKKINSNVEIIGRMTLTIPALKEIPLFIKNYSNLGFDKINFGYDKTTVPKYLINNPNFHRYLKKEINIALKSSKKDNDNNIDIFRLKQLNLL